MRLFLPLCVIWHLKKGKDLQPLLTMFLVATLTARLQHAFCSYRPSTAPLHVLTHTTSSTVQALKTITKLDCLVGALHAYPELNTEHIN